MLARTDRAQFGTGRALIGHRDLRDDDLRDFLDQVEHDLRYGCPVTATFPLRPSRMRNGLSLAGQVMPNGVVRKVATHHRDEEPVLPPLVAVACGPLAYLIESSCGEVHGPFPRGAALHLARLAADECDTMAMKEVT